MTTSLRPVHPYVLPDQPNSEEVSEMFYAMEAEDRQRAQDEYELRRDIEAGLERLAKKAARAGNPTPSVTLKELQRTCPNLPPLRRVSTLKAWTRLSPP